MTKFEEDLNKKMDLKEVPMYFTQSGCSMTRKTYIETNWIFDTYKNWHSDEEFQAKEKEIKRLRKINHLYKKAKGNVERMAVDTGERLNQAQDEIAYLKSQLQQQALPVVPECVAEWIEILKTKGLKPLKNPETYGETGFTEEKLQNIVFWISEHQEDYMRAWLDGYQVEKPQLFYLKHIDMSKRNSINDLYLKKYIHAALTGTGEYRLAHAMSAKGTYPSKDYCAFTQQEIDSMQTGSYEQIEVAE